MQTLPEDTTFQADAGGLIRLILTHTVVVGSALSWVLFGTLWTRVVGASLLLLSPFLLLIYVLARRLSQVRLDDAQQSVRLPLRPVPYAEITGLRAVATGDLLQITLRTGRWRKIALFGAWHSDQGEALLRALKERCPRAQLRRRNVSLWLSMAGPAALALLLYGGFHLYLEASFPRVRAGCQQADWLNKGRVPDGPTYRLGAIEFSVPEGFEPVESTAETSTLEFSDASGGRRLTVTGQLLGVPFAFNPSDQSKPAAVDDWIPSALGIATGYDLLSWFYCSRHGVLPLVVKGMLLPKTSADGQLSLHRWEGPSRKVLIKAEHRPGRGHAEILVREGLTEQEIYFVLRQPEPITKEMLTTLVLGVTDRGD